MRTIDEMKALLKIDGITWEEEQSVNAMERIWMKIDEIKALLALDGITWEESINTVDKMSPRKYRVRIQYAATNFFYPFVGGYGMTEEEAWQDAWGRYERRRAKSTAQA